MKKIRWNKNSLLSFVDAHIIDYPTPINLNYMWSFGSTAGLCLVIQIITGIFLAMHYTPHIDYAFNSVEHIMRDVNNGWLIRYVHANGASMFFIVVYCHIFRGLYYGSYMYPRGFLWCSGVIIFLLMMATAFMGYVLPWGQMSFWGATVITNLFSAIPFIGQSIVDWLWGGFSVSNATLNRFYSLHYLMPFVIAGFVILHLALLHKDGSNNPLGINTNVDTVSFYPYFYVKDLFSFLVLVTVFSFFVFFYPNALGHSDNYIPANPLSTPAHIVPEWYFLPFYAILRSIPDKLGGVVAMISAILVLMLLPVLNTSSIRSSKFRPIFAVAFWFLVSDFLILGWIGQKPVESPYIEIGMGATIFYFTFILILVPLIGFIESSLIYNEDGLILSEKSTSIDNLDFNKHVLELESENVVNSAIFLSNKPIYSNIHTDVILYF
jgi:quinol-cytochrome oxidoreductase complex cytochrome b subunit